MNPTEGSGEEERKKNTTVIQAYESGAVLAFGMRFNQERDKLSNGVPLESLDRNIIFIRTIKIQIEIEWQFLTVPLGPITDLN